MTPVATEEEAPPRPAAPSPVAAKRIAILGFARTVEEAPWSDTTIEFWGLNELYKQMGEQGRGDAWARWFEMHEAEYLGRTARVETPNEPTRHLEWLRAQPAGKPIYMLKAYADIPASVAYPLGAMTARFGRYFSSTIGYMIALAVAEILDARRDPRVAEPGEWIGLYGIDLGSDTEYVAQRPNAEYLIGWARGCGIEVYVPERAAVTHAPVLYGYEAALEHAGPVPEWYLQRQYAVQEDEFNQKKANFNTLDGLMQGCQFLLEHADDADVRMNDGTRQFIIKLAALKGEARDQASRDMWMRAGIMEHVRHALQICSFWKRGIYIPETDPFAPKKG